MQKKSFTLIFHSSYNVGVLNSNETFIINNVSETVGFQNENIYFVTAKKIGTNWAWIGFISYSDINEVWCMKVDVNALGLSYTNNTFVLKNLISNSLNFQTVVVNVYKL